MSASASTIAIIGGGQLGYMLCEAAARLELRTLVVTPDADAPALRIADEHIVTALDADGLAQKIAAGADVVTFEFEAVTPALLDALDAQDGLEVRPGTDIIRLIQNKALQKNWMALHGIPTLPYRVIDEPPGKPSDILKFFALPFVQKTQTGGYDGYGVQKITNEVELHKFWEAPSLLEPLISLETEIAVVVARGVAGDTEAFAPVSVAADPELNVLSVVNAPADLSQEIMDEARAIAANVVDRLGGVGVFAVEMFLTRYGELLVNEIAPRVHNTGHHTLVACSVSQFEQHMRAVAGLPLAPATTTHPVIMRNLLYTDKLEPLLGHPAGQVDTPDPSVKLYWYGKIAAKPFRKMGHITGIDLQPDEAHSRLDKALDDFLANYDGAAV
ncbi:MAG: 5-(carboxyamino)imidazole ribonucleotide synthase [Gammaproteobacteria bacterium]|nr:5-(carboxyamino)imidazole ribonucleotide synthase [Gammaproteobacteria bacterium]NND54986.1 5-(carboxyamino)imidazole ribonucleotide synthase [Gammaproteobacteria bacterium]